MAKVTITNPAPAKFHCRRVRISNESARPTLRRRREAISCRDVLACQAWKEAAK